MPDRVERTLRTLIVDRSEAFVTGVARWMAERPEIEVVGLARSGPEALAAVERLVPDLVVLDLVLPGKDGCRVVQALKARPRAPAVVVSTFFASNEARNAALAAGADAFVAKDDFTGQFERFLVEFFGCESPPERPVSGRTKSVRHGSRIEPTR